MKAVVMAGGEGTRLRPLTSNQPKPMVTVAGQARAWSTSSSWSAARRSRSIVATLAYMPQMIRGYFGEGSHLGVELDYSVEEVPAGTAGSVKLCEHYLDETFLVVSGDALTDIDLGGLIDFHRRTGAMATLALKRVREPARVRRRDHAGRRAHRAVPGEAEMGRGVLRHDQHRHLRARARGARADSDRRAVRLLEGAVPAPARTRARRSTGTSPTATGRTSETSPSTRRPTATRSTARWSSSIPGVRLRENVYIGEGSLAENLENIKGPAVIGNYCAIDPSAKIGRYTVLGNNVIVKELLRDGVLRRRREHLSRPALAGAGRIVGKNCEVRRPRRRLRGRGDRRRVLDRRPERDRAERAHLPVQARRDRRPRAALADLAAARASTTCSRPRASPGSCNVDVTPEIATRLAMAYGTTLGAATGRCQPRRPSRLRE